MYILAVDTSNNICTVTLNKNGESIDNLIENIPSKQSEMLMSMIEKLLDRSNIGYEDISLFATSIGPGSFTGVRIGIAAIKGIEIVTQKEILGISNLQVIAWKYYQEISHKQVNDNKNIQEAKSPIKITSCLNAMRGQFFVQDFQIKSCIVQDSSILLDEILLNKVSETISEPKLIFIDDFENYLNNNTKNSNIKYIATNCRNLIAENILNTQQVSDNIITNSIDIAQLSFSLHKFNLRKNNIDENGMTNTQNKVLPLYIRPPDAKKIVKK